MILKFLVTLTRLSIVLLAIATLLPFLPVGAWTVRLFDFPRIQLAALALFPIGGLICWSRITSWKAEQSVLCCVCTAILIWQISHIVQYTSLWPVELAIADASADTRLLTSSVVNLQFNNTQKSAVRDQLSSLGSELLLLIEIDKVWSEALGDLEDQYPYREGVVRGDGLGIMLWSKMPIVESEVRHLVSSKRASIFAKLQTSEGRVVNFVGLHPTPPGLEESDAEGRQDSRIRDAELMLVAKMVADKPNDHWIVAGDFNDVAWSHTTRVFKRISGLKDPRIGRGLYNTYHAEYPVLRFPIDQVFLSASALISRLARFRPAGSDHFAITTEFSLEGHEFGDPAPQSDDLGEAAEMISEGKTDARQQGDKPSDTRPSDPLQ